MQDQTQSLRTKMSVGVVALDRFGRKLSVGGAAPPEAGGAIAVSVGAARALAPLGEAGGSWSAALTLEPGVALDDEVVVAWEQADAATVLLRQPLRATADATPLFFGASQPLVDPVTDAVNSFGWSLGGGAGDAVQIWVDGRHVGDAEMGLPRADVHAHYPLLSTNKVGWRATASLEGLGLRLGAGERPRFEARLVAGGEVRAISKPMRLAYAGDLAAALALRARRTRVRRHIERLPEARLLGLLASDAFRRRWAAEGEAFAARRLLADELVRRGALDRDLRIRLHNGDLVDANPERDAVMARAFLFSGAYERGFLDLLPLLIGPGDTAIDAGAAYGVVTRCLARAGARVVAVEANLRLAAKLEASVAEAGLAAIEVVGRALGERPGALTFAALDSVNVGASRLIANGSAEEIRRTADDIASLRIVPLRPTDAPHRPLTAADLRVSEVEATTLDDICASRGLRDVALVKMDIEGAELIALRGGAKLLGGAFGRRPVVVLEFSRLVPQFLGSADDVWDVFEAQGWEIHVQDEGKSKGGRLRRLPSRAQAPVHDNIFCFPPERRPGANLVAG